MLNCQRLGCRGRIRRRKTIVRHRGATAVEFALVAPVVILVVFGAVVLAGLFMTQNTLTAAAREGGRVASLPSVTSQATIVAAVHERLQEGGVNPEWVTIDVSPTGLGSLTTGDEVSVSVSMLFSSSTWPQLIGIPSNTVLAAETTYIRE